MEEEIKNENEKKEEKKVEKKKNTLTIVIICVLAVALIGCLLFIFKDKIFGTTSTSKQTEEKQSNKKTDKNNDEEKESSSEETSTVEISDELKNQINKKINTLLYGPSINQSSKVGNYGFRREVLVEELSEYDKLYIAASTIEYDSLTDVYKEIDEVKKAIDKEYEMTKNTVSLEEIIAEYGQKSLKDFNNYYSSLFGKEIKKPDNKIGKCPSIRYYEDKELFIKFRPACGGASSGSSLTYISNYNIKDNNILVDFYYGSIVDDGFDIEPGTYADFAIENGKTIYKNKLDENIDQITSDNYTKFSHYIFTFKKLENDIYYFSKVEKVK